MRPLQDPETLSTGESIKLTYVLDEGNFHAHAITDMSVCKQKPFLATCSSDDQNIKVIIISRFKKSIHRIIHDTFLRLNFYNSYFLIPK